MKKDASPLRKGLTYAALALFAALFLYPFFIQIATSFKTDPDAAQNAISLSPDPFSLQGWKSSSARVRRASTSRRGSRTPSSSRRS